MLFNKNTFLPTVTAKDRTIKLVDADGAFRFLIKEPDATISHVERSVQVLQGADTQPITLTFPSPRDAREAMTLLQQALAQLRKNQAASEGGSGRGGPPEQYYFTPALDKQARFLLGFAPIAVEGLHVNGQKVSNKDNEAYAIVGQVLTWTDLLYTLDREDVLLLEYYGRTEV